MAGLPGRHREHSNPLLKFVLEVKKWPGFRGLKEHSNLLLKFVLEVKKMAGLPGRLKEHSNPLLKYLLEVNKKWPGSRGG